jgi:hypothetical protein
MRSFPVLLASDAAREDPWVSSGLCFSHEGRSIYYRTCSRRRWKSFGPGRTRGRPCGTTLGRGAVGVGIGRDGRVAAVCHVGQRAATGGRCRSARWCRTAMCRPLPLAIGALAASRAAVACFGSTGVEPGTAGRACAAVATGPIAVATMVQFEDTAFSQHVVHLLCDRYFARLHLPGAGVVGALRQKRRTQQTLPWSSTGSAAILAVRPGKEPGSGWDCAQQEGSLCDR